MAILNQIVGRKPMNFVPPHAPQPVMTPGMFEPGGGMTPPPGGGGGGGPHNSGFLGQLMDWRAQRPDVQGMDPVARRDALDTWRDGRPHFQDMFHMGGGQGSGPGAVPVPGAPAAGGPGAGGILGSIMKMFGGNPGAGAGAAGADGINPAQITSILAALGI